MININLDKAKTIAHNIRRAARLKEFRPYDEAISKQIPGQMEGAEVARQSIREKYGVMQSQIDTASSPEQLKDALGDAVTLALSR